MGVHKPTSLYTGYAYAGSPVNHIGWSKIGFSVPIPSGSNPAIDNAKRWGLSAGPFTFDNDPLTGRPRLFATPPWEAIWPANDHTSVTNIVDNTDPNEPIELEKVTIPGIGATWFRKLSGAIDLKQVAVSASFRQTAGLMDVPDASTSDNPIKFTMGVHALNAAGDEIANLFDVGDAARFKEFTYNELLSASFSGVRFIRFRINAVNQSN